MLQEMHRPDFHWLFGAALFVAFAMAFPLNAQGLKSEQAIDAIIGSTVEEEQQQADADPAKIVAAIEKSVDNTATVRKTSNLDKVDIVFLPDMVGETPPPAIVAAVEKYAKEIAALRKEIEGNAMLFHAIDSRSLLMRDVLAVSFEDNTATIYAAAKLPQN
jgi:hypothetical protein